MTLPRPTTSASFFFRGFVFIFDLLFLRQRGIGFGMDSWRPDPPAGEERFGLPAGPSRPIVEDVHRRLRRSRHSLSQPTPERPNLAAHPAAQLRFCVTSTAKTLCTAAAFLFARHAPC